MPELAIEAQFFFAISAVLKIPQRQVFSPIFNHPACIKTQITLGGNTLLSEQIAQRVRMVGETFSAETADGGQREMGYRSRSRAIAALAAMAGVTA